jgi:hypothetical protein
MARRLGLVIALGGLLAAGAPGCNNGETVVAPTLTATCSASPATGAAPLSVSFNLAVSGAQGAFSVAIDYGDGAQGADPARAHVYSKPGAFTAAFTVSTSSQSARCSTTVTVGPPPTPPPNLPPVAVFNTHPKAVDGTITGPAPFTVRFNMCPTADPEGGRCLFTMDFQGDRHVDSSGSSGAYCRRDHTYAAGTYNPVVCVTDIGPDGQLLHPFQCRGFQVVATP